MNKLFVIVGKSASGKTAISEELVKKYGFEKVISYTTRPIRQSEVNGKDYHYIDEDEFIDMLNKGEFIEYNSFSTKQGEWYYGTHRDVINRLKKQDNLIHILEPTGVKQLIDELGSNIVIPILVERDDTERLISSLKNRKDNPKEVCRRFMNDDEDFIEIESENIFKINNDILDYSVYEINEYIKGNKHLPWKCENNIKVGDEVIITNIKSKGGKHLSNRVGESGIVFNSIIKGGIKKYKVIFRDDDTAYFHRSEIEKIEEINEKEGR